MALDINKFLHIFDERLFSITLFCLLIGFYIIRWKIYYARYPPGPWGLPLFGYLYFFSKKPYKDFVNLAKKYGDVFSISIGASKKRRYLATVLVRFYEDTFSIFNNMAGCSEPSLRNITMIGYFCNSVVEHTIVLNNYDVIKEAFVKDGDIYAGKPTEGVASEFGDNKNIFVTEGDIWRQQSRFILSSMRDFGFGKTAIERHILDEAKLLTDAFFTNKNESVDIEKEVIISVTNVISYFVFGRRFTHDDKHIFDTFDLLNKSVSHASHVSFIDAFPILQHLLKRIMPGFSSLLHTKKKLYEFIDGNIEEHRHTFDENNIRDLIDVYLLKQKQNESRGMNVKVNIFSDEYLRANILVLFGAGIETTTGTLIWILKLLSLNPETQFKIQEEIDEVIGQERPPSMNDRTKMPFTESALLEIQRFISYIPLTFYHRVTKEATLNGYRIPKHTLILANLWSIHNDPRIWKNPSQFIPERFIGEDGKLSSLRDYVVPFSIGKRSCLGESLAKMELFLFTVSCLQRMKFVPTEDTSLECEELPIRKLKSCSLKVIPRNSFS